MDNIKGLYEALKDSKLFLDESDLRNQIASSPKEVFGAVSKSGLFIDYKDFEDQVVGKKKDGSTVSLVSPSPFVSESPSQKKARHGQVFQSDAQSLESNYKTGLDQAFQQRSQFGGIDMFGVSQFQQSREGKAGKIVADFQSNGTASNEDLKYLNTVAPKAAAQIVFNGTPEPVKQKIQKTGKVDDADIESFNQNHKQIVGDNVLANTGKFYSDQNKKLISTLNNIPGFDPSMASDPKYLNNFYKSITASKTKELAALDAEFPEKVIPSGVASITVRENGKEYESRRKAIDDNYAKAYDAFGRLAASKIATPDKDPLEIGLEYLKFADPNRYSVRVKAGRSGIDRDIAAVGSQLQYANATNLNQLKNVKASGDNLDNRFPEKLLAETRRRLGAELYKSDNWFLNLIPSISRLDEAAKQLPEKNREAYYKYIRETEKRVLGTDIPQSGAVNQFVTGVMSTVEGTNNYLASKVGARDEKDIAKDALNAPNKTRFEAAGAGQAEMARIKELNNKIKSGSTLTVDELEEKRDLETYTNIRSIGQKFLDGAFNLGGQVVFQALGTKGLAGLGTAAVRSAGLLKTAIPVGLATEEAIASSATNFGISQSQIANVAGAMVAYSSSYDGAAQEAIQMYPDDANKRTIYTTAVAGLNALTERIFKDEKIFDAFKRTLRPNIGNLVNEIATGKLTKELLQPALTRIVGDGLKILGQSGVENLKETTEEIAVSVGTSLTKLLLSSDKFVYSEALDDAVTTATTMFTDGALVALVAGVKGYRENKVGIGVLSKLGVDKTFTADVKSVLNAQILNGDITKEEAEKKINVINKIVETNTKDMPRVNALAKISETASKKYAIALSNEKLLKQEFDATTDEALKSKILEDIKASENIRKAILNKEVFIDDNYAVVTPEEAANSAQELSNIERLTPEQIQVTGDSTEFANQMQSAQGSLGRGGMSVSPYAQDEYDSIAAKGGKFLRAAGNKILALLKPNGEMVSLVKDATVKTKGAAQAMISKMKDMGGLFMDNYDIYLTPIYEKAGYKVVARVPFNEEYAPEGWDAEDSPLKNKPDVVFMVRNDFAPAQDQTFTDYEEAQRYTQGLVDNAVAQGIAKLPAQASAIDTALNKAIPKATKALEKAGIKFKVVDGATDRVGAMAARGNQALFISDDGTIIIDRSKLQNDIEAGLVVWHEASHPVMNIIRNTNKPLYDAVVRGIKEAAKNNKGVADALNWAQSQEQYDNADTQNDEAIVETIGRINSGLIDVSKMDTGLRQQIIDFVNSIAKFFGIDPILNDTDIAAFKKTVSQVADALKTGRDISEVVGDGNVKEYMNNLTSPEVIASGQLASQARSEDVKINVYETKEVSNLPVRSMQDIYEEFGGKAVVINSDPTRVGILNLPSGKRIFMYGGPAYLSVKENVDGNIGFATTQLGKVSIWVRYMADVFGADAGVTFVATQAPTSMLSNSYALRYVMDAISMLPKSVLKSQEFKNEFFGNDLILLKDAFGEKGYNDFVNKYKKADLSKPEVIDGMIAEMAYKVGDDNKPASFKARGAFVANLLGGLAPKASLKGVEGDAGFISKKPNKFISKQLMDRLGINAEKLMRDIGEPSLVDLYMNEGKWGFAVAGFDMVGTLPKEVLDAHALLSSNPDNKEYKKSFDKIVENYVASFQNGGVKHPLFNAKFPGKNPFILDGVYEVNKMFKPIEMTSGKGNPYTKTAAQMLAGSMYVKGQPSQTESSFKYVPTESSGNRIQASVGGRNIGELEVAKRTDVATDKLKKLFERDNIPLSLQEAKDIVQEVIDWSNWYDGIAEYSENVFAEYAEDFLSMLPLSSMANNSASTVALSIGNIERVYKGENPLGVAEYYGYVSNFLGGKGINSDKMYNFFKALTGDKDAIAVDMHVWSIIMGKNPNKKQVNPKNQKEFERAKEFVRLLSKELGLAPREVQASLWAANILRTGGKPDSYEEYIAKQIRSKGLEERIQGWRNKGYKPFSEVRKRREAETTSNQASVGNRNLAPNGKPSKLNDKQYKQVRTPEFKNWFGDWENDPANASKVVDENGEPLVVYHNSPSKDVQDFKGYVTYFTDNKEYAGKVKGTASPNQYDAYLNVRKPYNSPSPLADVPIEVHNTDQFTNPRFIKSGSSNYDAVVGKDAGQDDGVTYAVFNPNQIKSATGNSGAFSTTDNRIQASVGNRDIINGFYSPIEDRINTFKQPKASVQKWKEIVGVKSDEAVFSGLADWLGGMKPDSQLSKEEVSKFIKDNRIEIKEVELGNVDYRNLPEYKEADQKAIAAAEAIQEYQQKWWDSNKGEDYDALQSAKEDLNKWSGVKNSIEKGKETNGVTKYENYQLPGGENYKEMLVTLPIESKVGYEKAKKERQEVFAYWESKGWTVADATENDPESVQRLNRANNLLQQSSSTAFGEGKFKSTHFDEPNIITHLRMNTRTDADGKKVLFLEEVQSDWGQKGKKDGFKRGMNDSELRKFNEIKNRQKEILNGLKSYKLLDSFVGDILRSNYQPEEGKLEEDPVYELLDTIEGIISGRIDNPYYDDNDTAEVKRNRDIIVDEVKSQIIYNNKFVDNEYYLSDKDILEILDAYNEDSKNGRIKKQKGYDSSRKVLKVFNEVDELGKDAFDVFNNATKGITNPAPYVTNTNAWVKLGLKVALKEAVKQGADRIAWTTGDQQNERYDLSKQVDYIDVFTNDDGTYEVGAYKGRDTVSRERSLKDSQLEGLLGKDLATKIIEDTKNHKHVPGEENLLKTYRGNDLAVGGKGMKAFYGDANNTGIVGNVAKALVKELTGNSVDIVESVIDTSAPIAKQEFRVENDPNLPMGRTWVVLDREGGIRARETNRTDAMNAMRDMTNRSKEALAKGQKIQPAIDITPELAQSVQQGMPQFSVGNRSEDDLRAPGTGKERDRALANRINYLQEDTFQKIKDDAKTYFQKSNKQTKEAVEDFMRGFDTLDVADYVMSDPKITDSSLVWMAAETSKRLTKEIKSAKEAGDDVMVQKLSDKQAEIFNEFSKKATDLGQAVQAFVAFADDPNAVQFHFNKIVSRLKDLKVTLTDDQTDTIKEKLQKIGQAKDGIPRDEAIVELAHYLAGISPVNPMDIIQALWYAKILSGMSTQSKNLLANMYNTFAEVAIMATRESIKNLSLMPYVMAMKGLAGGLTKGAVVARDITKTGLSKQDAGKYFNQNALETFSWGQTKLGQLGGGSVGNVVNYTPPLNVSAWKYVGRLLSASDALFSTANQEAFANMYAWVQASKEGKSTPAVNNYTRANQLLNNTKGKIEDAQNTAKQEGYKPGTDRFTRRVIEIISQSRGSDLLNAAEKFGAKVTLNYEPTGFIKPIYDTVVSVQKTLPIAKLWVPFTRIVANLTEQMLDYSPAGLVKAAVGRENPFSKSSAKLSGDDKIDLLVKSAMAISALAIFSQKIGEDDDDWFEITAGGTGDMKKNYELQGEGWRPYTITLKDGTKINYADWPIRGILAGLGGVRDGINYGKDEGQEDMLALYAWGYAATLYDNSIMKGLADFIDIFVPSRNRYAGKPVFNEDGEQTGVDKWSYVKDGLSKWSAQQVKSVVVSNLTQQVLKMSDEAQGDPIKIAQGGQVLYRDIPYINKGLKPVIDVFGDIVSPNTSEKLFPFYKVEKEKKNKMLEMLHDNKLFVGIPGNRNMITLKGNSRPMNDDELYEYQRLSGQYTKDLIYKIMDESGEQRKEIVKAKLSAAVSSSRARAYADVLIKSFRD